MSTSKKVAIILVGLHYACKQPSANITESMYVANDTNYKFFLKNMKNTLYKFFENQNYLIETTIITGSSHCSYQQEFIDDYQPRIVRFLDNSNRFEKLLCGVEIISKQIDNDVNYDLVCITRPDIFFLRHFNNIDLNKLNIVSTLESDDLIDDNLYILPKSLVKTFLNILYNIRQTCDINNRLVMHYAKSKICSCLNVNYMYNEHTTVHNLSFFKLRYQITPSFFMPHNFSDNIIYFTSNQNASMLKLNNSIQLRKLTSEYGGNVWLGYQLANIGKYLITFDILSDTDIGDFNFIKTHKPIKFHQLPSSISILANQRTHVSLVIETQYADDLLCTIFDNFQSTICVTFYDISIAQINNKQNGILLSDVNVNKNIIDSNGLIVSRLGDNEFEVIKMNEFYTHPFRWFGYDVDMNRENIIMSFEIKFLDTVPDIRGNFAIKTHNPIEHYTNWLSDCKLNEFVKIDLPIFIKNERQLIIFIMDNFLQNTHFIIKNISFTPQTNVLNRSDIRVALLVAGEMRNYNNVDLLQINENKFLKNYNYDIFVSTWDKLGSSPYHGTVCLKPYADYPVSESDIRNVYKNVRNVHIENFDNWKNSLPSDYKTLYDRGFPIVGTDRVVNCTVFPQLYKLWDANEMKKNYENENHFKYDLVIRLRGDMGFVHDIPDAYAYNFLNSSDTTKHIWTINPPKIFYPNRIYDIFFYGNSDSMDRLCDAWTYILALINHPYENGLLKVDTCRVLYVCCLLNQIKVSDILYCMGDIYRDEPINEYINKIQNIFN